MFKELDTEPARNAVEAALPAGGAVVISALGAGGGPEDGLHVCALLDALEDNFAGRLAPAWADRFRELKEDYFYYHPREVPFVLRMTGYSESERIPVEGPGICCFQVLPEGHIVTGERCGALRVRCRDDDGGWSAETLAEVDSRYRGEGISSLHALPGGRIALGGDFGYLAMYTPGDASPIEQIGQCRGGDLVPQSSSRWSHRHGGSLWKNHYLERCRKRPILGSRARSRP